MSKLQDRANHEFNRDKEIVVKKVVQPVKNEVTYLKEKAKSDVEGVKEKAASMKKDAYHKVENIKDKVKKDYDRDS